MIPQDFLAAVAQEQRLSFSEQEALFLAMAGKPTAAIASELGISGDAVRKRLSEVYQKFQIEGRGPVKLTKLQQQLVARYQEQLPAEPSIPSLPNPAQSPAQPQHGSPQHNWGEAPDSAVFYGREAELAQLQRWLVGDRCRLVTIIGMAGIGKTSLAVRLTRQVQNDVDAVIWLSLRQTPRLCELLSQLFEMLPGGSSYDRGPQAGSASSGDWPNLESQLTHLMSHLRAQRYLLVLDGAESMLQSGQLTGVYREGYEDYGELLRRVGQESHRSALLVTSQEKPAEVSLLEGEASPVRSLTLTGLDISSAERLLKEKGLTGDVNHWGTLIEGYRGNPFMLQMVATTIRDVFDGDVTSFLTTTLFTHDISDYIEEVLDRVSALEATILNQLAAAQQSMTVGELGAAMPDSSMQDLIQALKSLKQRSLLETSEGRFSVPPAVLEVLSA
ncbi:MAG: NB-ARC domain-containing protein [Elainellaceae cyanobacterium]